MQSMKTLQEVRNIFENDRFATENGAVIEEIGKHSAVAANWGKIGCVSLHSDISFLGVPKGKKLIAKAFCVKDGKTTACYRVDVTDELGNLTATVTTTGYHVGEK